MHITSYSLESLLDILILKLQSRLVGFGYDEKIETEREKGDQRGGEYVRDHHPVEADSAGENRNYLCISRHLRSEEDYRNEHEQRTEHVHEVRHKVDVIVEDDSLERCFLAHKVVNLLTVLEDDDDADDEQQRYEECRYEFLDDIYIKSFWSKIKIHLD